MVRTGRFLTLLFLLILFCCALCGCGQAADSSGLSGSYELSGAEDAGLILPDGEIKRFPLHFRLNPGGSGIVTDGETVGRLQWSVYDGFVMVEAGGILLGGSAEGTDLLLKAAGSDTVLRFVPSAENSAEPLTDASQEDNAGAAAEISAETESYSWYGWWKISDSDGSMPTSWYDCCARLTRLEDEAFLLTFWDEDGSAEAPLASVTFREKENGRLVSLYGTWLFDDISFGEWEIAIPCEILCMEDLEHRAEGTDFHYSFYLRSWGDRWVGCPEEQLPFYFDDWYLPLLEKGSEMPDRIPVAELEKERETPDTD